MFAISAIALGTSNRADSAFDMFANMAGTSSETSATPSEAPSTTPATSSDSIKVRKTNYPHGEHPEQFSFDLQDPENLKQDTCEFVDKTGMFRVGTKLGDKFLTAPTLMTPQEYMLW